VAPLPRPTELAAATPPDRDRFLDLLRAGSIAVVVLGHWLMAAVVRRDGVLRADNALAAVTWLQPLTWLLQVMPVFFMVSGCTSARTLARAGTAPFLVRRARRLLPPTLLLVGGWLVLAAVLAATPVAERTVHDATSVAAQPLWFLAVYLLLVLLAPAQLRLHARHPWLLLAVAPVVAAVLDAGRLTGVASGPAILNYVVVFAVAQELGFGYADGSLLRLPRRGCVAGAGLGVLVLLALTAVGPYPVSMVGVPGEKVSNMSPPTVCVLVVTLVQVGLLLALRPALTAWLARPRVWLVTVAANTVVLTVFLWHLSAFVVAAALLAVPAGLVDDPGSGAWWAAKPLYVAVAVAVLAALVAATARVEARARGTGPDLGTGRAVVAVLLCVVGLAGVAASGFAHPLQVSGRALLGVRFSPAWAVGLLLLGSLLALGPRRPGDASPR
jgi:fucose 4-O-acetylase-like acetyltransferase